jgi:antitoxin VapB
MGLSIKNDETERLVRELARRKGVGVTTAIRLAVSNELAATPAPEANDFEERWQRIREIQKRAAELPVINPEVNANDWMYDENGLPH